MYVTGVVKSQDVGNLENVKAGNEGEQVLQVDTFIVSMTDAEAENSTLGIKALKTTPQSCREDYHDLSSPTLCHQTFKYARSTSYYIIPVFSLTFPWPPMLLSAKNSQFIKQLYFS